MNHDLFINQTFLLAQAAAKEGNHPFGALAVLDGEVIAQAKNQVETSKDLTAHAELLLIRDLSKNFDPSSIIQMSLYSSTEPCPMCAGAIYWSGINKIYYGCSQKQLCQICKISQTLPAKEILSGKKFVIKQIGASKDFEKQHKEFW